MCRRRLGPERDGGECVGADVDGQDLHDAERQREPAARQRPNDERGQLGDVVGEVVGEETADVYERGAALLDGGHDGIELIIEQHQVSGLAGDVGSRPTHGDADVGFVQRWSVVDPVTGHGDDVAPPPKRPGDAQLVLRRDPGDDDAVPVDQRAEQLDRRREGRALEDEVGRWPVDRPGRRSHAP